MRGGEGIFAPAFTLARNLAYAPVTGGEVLESEQLELFLRNRATDLK